MSQSLNSSSSLQSLIHGPAYYTTARMIKQEDTLSFGTIFYPFNSSGAQKTINLDIAEDFEVEMSSSTSLDPSSATRPTYISRYAVSSMQQALEQLKDRNIEAPRVRLVFFMDMLGIPVLGRADLLFEEQVWESVPGSNPPEKMVG